MRALTKKLYRGDANKAAAVRASILAAFILITGSIARMRLA